MVTLLRHLDRTRFQLALAVVDLHGAAYLTEVPNDVELIDLRCTRVRYALLRIVQLIRKRRPDVVFSTLDHLNLALAMLRPLLPNDVRYIGRGTCVLSENLTAHPHSRLFARMYRWFYPRFDRVVCQSVDMREDLIDQFAFPPGKAVIIHNPVDVVRVRRLAAEAIQTGYQLSESTVNLVAAGRLCRQKGFDLLIEALALCGDSRLRLTLLGEGPLRPALEQLAQQKGVADRIRFVGFQNNPYPFFAQADAFVLSSRFEGFPNAVLEALACGTPVISTPAPGGLNEIAELVSGSVLLASAVDSESLSIAIKRFLHGEVTKEPISLTPFLVDEIVDRYQKLLVDRTLSKVA